MNKPSAQVYSNNREMHATTFDEAMAIIQAHKGDNTAFGDLVRAYQQKAYSIAYGFVGNRDDALELA